MRLVPLLALYAGLLHWTYQEKIAPAFGYLGSRYRDPEWTSYAFAGVMALSLLFILPRHLKRPSDFALWILYLMVLIPAVFVPQYADILSRDRSLVLAVAVATNFAMICLLTRWSPILIQLRVALPPALFWTLVGGLSFAFYGYLFATQGVRLNFAHNLEAVRDVRLDYRDQVASQGPLLGYLIRVQANALNPLLIVRGINSRQWFPLAAGTGGQIVIFGVTGYKITLLSIPALLALAALFRYSKRLSGSLLLWAVSLMTFIAIVIDQIRGGTLVFIELCVDRLLLVPGVLTAAHVLVFDGHDKMMWSYSFLAPFFDNTYGTTPAFLVGSQFSGDAQVSANANFFADGFANLGWPGMTLESLALVLLLWLVDGASRHLTLRVTAPLMLLPTLALVNGSVFTSIITGGVGIVLVLMASLPPDRGVHAPLRTRLGEQKRTDATVLVVSV